MSGTEKMSTSPRFAFLDRAGECPRPVYDQILSEVDGCVVTPTLGSIVPNWLLIVPQMPVLNFAEWRSITGMSPVDLIGKVLGKRSLEKDFVWFEHGPVHSGTVVGCGVDQAHLHVIYDAPFSAEQFQHDAAVRSGLTWKKTAVDSAYAELDRQNSYFVAGSASTALFAQNVERAGSQFFRKVVASLAHQPDAWNYRTHPHLAQVDETIRTFRLS